MAKRILRLVARIRAIHIAYSVIFLAVAWWLSVVFYPDSITQREEYLDHFWYGLRIRSFLQGMLMIAFLGFAVASALRKSPIGSLIKLLGPWDKAMLIYALIAPIGALVGLINQNDFMLLTGDAYGMLVIPLTYFTARLAIDHHEYFRFWSIAIGAIFLASLVRGLDSLVGFMLGQTWTPTGAVSWILPAILPGLMLFESKLAKRWHLYLFILAIGVLVLTLSREIWLATVLAALLILLLSPKHELIKILKPLLGIALVILASAGLLLIADVKPISTAIGDIYDQLEVKITSALEPDQGLGESSARRAEVIGSVGTMSGSELVVGRGFGAEYIHPMFDIKTHHVHVTPASLLFRSGIVGVLLMILLVVGSFALAIKIVRSPGLDRRKIIFAKMALIYFTLSFIDSFLTYQIVNDVFWGFFLGTLVNLRPSDGVQELD